MGKASVEITGLQEAINNVAKEKMRNAASKIADELTKFAEHAIIGFYDHYQPKRYKRHGGLSSAFSRYYRNPHNTIYYGGVEILPSKGSYSGWQNHSKISVDPNFISKLSIYFGMHGNVAAFPHPPVNVPPMMHPSPLDLINKKRDEIVDGIDSYFG